MEKASGSRKPATRLGFGFSWADEVEREEQQQQQQEEGSREEKKEQPTRADPFGAARPREVVLAEKGVDWRARDRELDAAATTARTRASRTVPAPACAARTPHPRRQAVDSTPRAKDAPPPVSRGAWGGGKRKCAGDVPAPATARRVRPAGDQGRRRVFGELNVGEGCGSTVRSAAKKVCNSGGGRETEEGSKASEVAVADGGASKGCSAAAATATVDEPTVGKKRKGRNRGRGGRKRGSKKTENQQTPLL